MRLSVIDAGTSAQLMRRAWPTSGTTSPVLRSTPAAPSTVTEQT
jgi:hypothetical protein